MSISLSWSDYTVMGTREMSYQNGWCLSGRKLGTCFPSHLNLRGKKWPLEALSGVAGNESRTKCMSSREQSFCCPFLNEGPGRSATLASRWGLALHCPSQNWLLPGSTKGSWGTLETFILGLAQPPLCWATFGPNALPLWAPLCICHWRQSPSLVHMFAVWSGEGCVCRPMMRGAWCSSF